MAHKAGHAFLQLMTINTIFFFPAVGVVPRLDLKDFLL